MAKSHSVRGVVIYIPSDNRRDTKDKDQSTREKMDEDEGLSILAFPGGRDGCFDFHPNYKRRWRLHLQYNPLHDYF